METDDGIELRMTKQKKHIDNDLLAVRLNGPKKNDGFYILNHSQDKRRRIMICAVFVNHRTRADS